VYFGEKIAKIIHQRLPHVVTAGYTDKDEKIVMSVKGPIGFFMKEFIRMNDCGHGDVVPLHSTYNAKPQRKDPRKLKKNLFCRGLFSWKDDQASKGPETG
jgi:hypothetical protein